MPHLDNDQRARIETPVDQGQPDGRAGHDAGRRRERVERQDLAVDDRGHHHGRSGSHGQHSRERVEPLPGTHSGTAEVIAVVDEVGPGERVQPGQGLTGRARPHIGQDRHLRLHPQRALDDGIGECISRPGPHVVE